MQTSPDSLTSLIPLIQARAQTERVAQPEPPALQQFID
jgi:hypothetical protein